jgi:hypothetical protein
VDKSKPLASAEDGGEKYQPFERFKYLINACSEVVEKARSAGWTPPETVILDGELLVYDEGPTPAGRYDELGSPEGVVSFGTHFWVTVKPDARTGEPRGG